MAHKTYDPFFSTTQSVKNTVFYRPIHSSNYSTHIMLEPEQIEQLLEQAKDSDRKRSHLLLHDNQDCLLHRVVIALQRGTYVVPHNHSESQKEEILFVLQGEVCVVLFNEQGMVLDKQVKSAGELSAFGEYAPGTWHTLYPVSNNAIIIEVKRGPFIPTSPTEFARWAPKEGSPGVNHFLAWLYKCDVNARYLPGAD